ncbi:DUF2243 domain-containing protein [Sphingomonas sp. DT-51]|uniref:DUF2243 domain-containing protein n=1 Tax=Sphingomonas sp. DT-51 TaxID=3396165 RepID=UPI003F199340
MPTITSPSPPTRAALALGFALGGFFDGILLHQILQWHHLLSRVSAVTSLRAQLLWDGYFHALMYAIAIAALAALWRARERLDGGARLGGALLLGFGTWHVIDAMLSHWLLGIHRVRLDVPDPLRWDLLWLAAFGLAPMLAGYALRRRAAASSTRWPLAVVALLAAGTGAWSLRPVPAQRLTTIVFAPGVSPAAAVAALRAADARIAWSDSRLQVVVAAVPAGRRLGLYAAGALLVAGAGLPGGCAGWSG